MSVDELRQQLEALQRSHDELLKSITRSNGSFSPDQVQFRRVSTREAIFADSSIPTDDEDDEDESFFVQDVLPAQSFDHEHLREHLKKHDWNEHGRQILSSLFKERGRLKEPNLFPTRPGPADDRSHYSHFQVYDVGTTGVAELVESSGPENTMSRASEIWYQLKDIGANAQNSKVDKPVGRITIAREPSPILFGALHLTMNNAFDMDELFRNLVTTDACSAHMERAFEDDPRHQKTFFFNFEYYTLIGEDCQPMEWQLADRRLKPGHTPLTRCGAVVALSLYDDKPKRLRTRGRRGQTRDGRVQNIWSPWQVLVIECFPDWRATADTFEHGHRYLNGPEAFLHALLTEYRDARKRYTAIYERITRLVTPPNGFLFDGKLRDQRLFEDRDFSWTRRYFWAHQTLGNVNDTIKTMIDSFEDTFTDDVWEGKSDTIWPLFESSPRNDHWRHRLRMLRTHFEREMKELRILISENNERRHEIRTLQEHLFSGTSIQESRKSVELTDITVQQGRNIKLLTLVNMIFVPLTFVTSVFGMTNMDTTPAFWQFGVTLVTVCVPFFALIGFLNTDSGYRIWMAKTKQIWKWMHPPRKPKTEKDSESRDDFLPGPIQSSRTFTTEEAMRKRLGENTARRSSDTANEGMTLPHIRRIIEQAREEKKVRIAMGNGARTGRDAVIQVDVP